jgi:hypothetical protein
VLSSSRLWSNNTLTANNVGYAISAMQNSMADVSVLKANNCYRGIRAMGGFLTYGIAEFTSCAVDITTSDGGRVYTGAQTSIGKY